MFRLQQSQPDPAEEQKRVSSEVRFNFILFGTIIAVVRLGAYTSYIKCSIYQYLLFVFFIFNSSCGPAAFKHGIGVKLTT